MTTERRSGNPGWLAAPALALAAACGSRGTSGDPAPEPPATAEATASTSAAPAPSASTAAAAARTPTLVPFDPPKETADARIVELGRILFFDPRLSGDNAMSCATCHAPDKRFTDGRPVALGSHGRPLARNTPTVLNLDARAPYFLDGRAASVEAQALMPIENPSEMAQDLGALVEELSQVPEYVARFRGAFPGAGITEKTIAKAIAAYERSLVSAGAPYDRHLRGERGAISVEAMRGMGVFVNKGACVKCHDGPQLTDNSFHNIGVGGSDEGRFAIVSAAILRGAFKTPGLRDVELTAPYFHDGSAKTLEEVVEHYNRGGVVKENLDPDIKPLDLTAQEKSDLVAFMRSLTGEVEVGPLPRPPAAPTDAPKTAIRALMQSINEGLGVLDKQVASLDPASFERAQAQAMKLVERAERIEAARGLEVAPARVGELRERVGDLIVALHDLERAAFEKKGPEMIRAHQSVRDRCEGCHGAFRHDEKEPR